MNSPDIAGLIESDTYQPVVASLSQGHAVGNPGSNPFAGREFVQEDFGSGLQRPREPNPATLRIDHQCVTGLREWGSRIESGDAKRNLSPNSGSTRSGVYRFFSRVHR